ncbi:PIP5K9 [Symbiodinium sp. KB8]|nr:PIP5K9 [Symbiodinium sp. KB8]
MALASVQAFGEKAHFSEGASQAFMCFSQSNAFLMKTLTQAEAEQLRSMLPAYTRYVCTHPDTLLVKFLMAVRIKLYGQPFYVVVMNNCLHTPEDIHQRFDLKGSWVGRSANKARGVQPSFKQAYMDDPTRLAGNVLLDNDLNFRLRLEPAFASRLARQVEADATLLRDCGIMDYSLLLGVHREQMSVKASTVTTPTPGVGGGSIAVQGATAPAVALRSSLPAGVQSPTVTAPGTGGAEATTATFTRGAFNIVAPGAVEGASRYYLGIIDMLQGWTLGKVAENFAKTTILCQPKDGLSAVPPHQYHQRFVSRIAKQVINPKVSTSELQVRNVRARQRQAAPQAPSGFVHGVTSALQQLLQLKY